MTAVLMLANPLPASAHHPTVPDAVETFEYSDNMRPRGLSERAVPPGNGVINSDLAFWGKHAFQGTYEGFRIIDISSASRPREVVNFTDCVSGTTTGNQGDVVVWQDILVRSWNSPALAAGSACGGVAVPPFQEGLHVFDISDPAHPVVVAFVATPCGSHTATGVPDLAHRRLLIYNNPSSGAPGCRGIDIVEVPLAEPEASSYLSFLPSGDPSGPLLDINPPSPAAGSYGVAGADFGPTPSRPGITGELALVNDGSAAPTEGCGPLVGFPAGAIALIDRGTCNFTVKARNAQDAGAVAMIVVNNVPGPPNTMGGNDPAIVIPAVQVSLVDGNTIKAGLPVTATVTSHPESANPDRSCHDTGVILGRVNLAACAGGDGFSVWSLGVPDGGSKTAPRLLYSQSIEGMEVGHSASFTWDGRVLLIGHEPGGGGEARCQASSDEVDKTLFFFRPRTGAELGRWVLERPQTATENCTIHNYNVVPTDRRYVLVSGNYQMGIAVVDFTDPAHPRQIAFADPAPLSTEELTSGGDWSTYWYDGRIYESDQRRGLIVWELHDRAVRGALRLGHLNPQTLEFSLHGRGGR
jgi:hypothetical protein